MSTLKEGDRVVFAMRGWRTDLPAGAPGTVLDFQPCRGRSMDGPVDFAVVSWDDPHNPPCGYDQLPADWLIPVEDEIPADWVA